MIFNNKDYSPGWIKRQQSYYEFKNIDEDGVSKARKILNDNLQNLEDKVVALSIHNHYDGTLAGTFLLEGDSNLYEFSFNPLKDYLKQKGLIIDPDEWADDWMDDYDDHHENRYFLVRLSKKDYERNKDWEGDWSNLVGFITEDTTFFFRELVAKKRGVERVLGFPLEYKKEI